MGDRLPSVRRAIDALAGYVERKNPLRITVAEVASGYAGGKPAVVEAGEETAEASTRTFPVSHPDVSNLADADKLVKVEVPGFAGVIPFGEPSVSGGLSPYEITPTEYIASATSTGSNGGADVVRVYRKYFRRTFTVSNLVVRIAFVTTNPEFSLALFNATNAAAILNTGAITASVGTLVITLGSPVLVPAGWYYFAWCFRSATTLVQCAATPATEYLNVANADISTSNDSVIMGTGANAGSSGAMPSTLGALTKGSFPVPMVKFV